MILYELVHKNSDFHCQFKVWVYKYKRMQEFGKNITCSRQVLRCKVSVVRVHGTQLGYCASESIHMTFIVHQGQIKKLFLVQFTLLFRKVFSIFFY